MRAHPYRLRERKLTVHWSDCAPSQPYYAPFAPPHVRSSRATRSDSHSSSVILSLLPPLQGPRSCSAHLACRSALASSASASRSWPPQIVTAGTSAACAGIFGPMERFVRFLPIELPMGSLGIMSAANGSGLNFVG